MISRRRIVQSGFGMIAAANLASRTEALAQESTPAAGSQDSFGTMLGVNVPELPVADEGVQVVLADQVKSSVVGVVIHNRTNADVEVDGVTGIARDASGSLYAVVEGSIEAPKVLAPGHYGIGQVYFDKTVTKKNGFSFEVNTVEPGHYMNDAVDIMATEVSIDGEDAIGVVKNSTDTSTNSFFTVIGMFFDAEGEICGCTTTELNGDVDPGKIGTFSTDSIMGKTSDSFLFAASGRSF